MGADSMRGPEFYRLVEGFDRDVDAMIRDMLSIWGERATSMTLRGATVDHTAAAAVHAAVRFASIQIFSTSDDRKQWEWYRAFDSGVVSAFFLTEIDRHRATWGQGNLMPPAPLQPPRLIT